MTEKTPAVKSVSTFKHPKSFGFTGSAGQTAVKGYMRTPTANRVKPPPKNPGLAIRKPGGF